jgi:hypothetical protein
MAFLTGGFGLSAQAPSGEFGQYMPTMGKRSASIPEVGFVHIPIQHAGCD